MPTANAYQIGSTLVGLATLKSIGLPDPKHTWKPYADYARLGDGSVRGIGLPIATWQYGYLTQAQRNLFRAFCTGASAEVFIETRQSDKVSTLSDAFAQYSATMIWPLDEQKDAFRRISFVIEFHNLVAV